MNAVQDADAADETATVTHTVAATAAPRAATSPSVMFDFEWS